MKLIASTSLLAAIILGGCSLKDPAPSDSARAADSIDAAVGTVDPTITDTDSAAVTGDSAGSTMPPADASGNKRRNHGNGSSASSRQGQRIRPYRYYGFRRKYSPDKEVATAFAAVTAFRRQMWQPFFHPSWSTGTFAQDRSAAA
jgi:hypothetical protein